jgi:hypothetical protein
MNAPYLDLGAMATISRFRGIATIGVSWTIALVGCGRQQRTITVRQTLGVEAEGPRRVGELG